MWTRKELKDKAKVAFKGNYWKSVFAALVLALLIGGMSVYSSASSATSSMFHPVATTSSHTSDDVNVKIEDGKIVVDVDDHDGGKVHVDLDADDIEDLDQTLESLGVDERDISSIVSVAGPGLVFAGVSIMLASLVVLAFAIALYVFIFSPLEVGAQRFFIRNLNQPAEVKEIAFGYDNNYKEIVKTLFLRSLFIFLWALLFIIPGIYKAYQYRMIPYLLAEDPAMTKDQAFAESKRMMDGQKWNAFVLDLSFIGWNILSAMTLGILGVFYVTPYQVQTNAALYEKLRYGLPAPQQPMQAVPVAPVAPAPGYGMQVNGAPVAGAQATGAPIIVPTAQPPVPSFAAEQPVQPMQPAQPTQPVQTTEPLPPAQLTQPIESAEPVQPTEQMKPAEAVEPTVSAEPVAPESGDAEANAADSPEA